VVNELMSASAVDDAAAGADYADSREKADTLPDRHQRDLARKEVHWAEARLRAAKLQREHA